MLIGDLIKVYRDEEKDNIAPYFTSDFMLLTYLNEALIEYAKQTMSIYDTDSELTRVYVPTGFMTVPFDHRILEIQQAFVSETNEALTVVSANSSVVPRKGLLLDSALQRMTLTKAYDKPVTLRLRVIRKPLRWLDINDIGNDIPDIPNEEYRVLLYYIKYLAFDVSDAEIFDPNKAANNLSLFEQRCQSIRELNLRRRSATQSIMMESLWNV